MIGLLKNEKELVINCQTGDLQSFKRIYDHYREPLYRIAFRMTGAKEDTEDILQMTFIKLFRGIKNFRFESKLSTYLYRILINLCYDFTRQKKDNINTTFEEADLFYHPQNELQLQLEEAIQFLPYKMRECFILYAIEGFRQEEIAEMLNISVGTVKAHIYGAKRKLKNSLNTVFEGKIP